MAGEQKPACNLLEQFILLARGTSGSALIALINQVLEAPGIYVFGELLELTNVREGKCKGFLTPDTFSFIHNLKVVLKFDFSHSEPEQPASFDGAPEEQVEAFDHCQLSFQNEAFEHGPCIPYSVLLKDLDMRNLRELEDLIIEAVYTDIIQGKLDQRNQVLEVDFCIGRDIQRKDISNVIKTLNEWCDGCEAVLLGIEQQVLNIKKTLKATASSSSSAQEMDQQLVERECPHPEQRQPTKKISKVKGLVSSRH
ncbi:putative COP9 signalosome complex subunit 7b protein [Naja naja]|nr:putative COP9 signalosome complex subunit 7b protein [Naja naja]